IRKLRSRVTALRAGKSTNDPNTNNVASGTGRLYNDLTVPSGSERSAVQEQSTETPGPKIFGAELFRNSNISFAPNMNMPTPQGYIVGPGDELLIDITGDNEASYNLKVSPEGYINIEYVGRVAVGGLSIEAATSKLRNVMSATYPAMRTGRSSVAI